MWNLTSPLAFAFAVCPESNELWRIKVKPSHEMETARWVNIYNSLMSYSPAQPEPYIPIMISCHASVLPHMPTKHALARQTPPAHPSEKKRSAMISSNPSSSAWGHIMARVEKIDCIDCQRQLVGRKQDFWKVILFSWRRLICGNWLIAEKWGWIGDILPATSRLAML